MYIMGVSMVTPIGGDTKTTAASVNAGINRIQESRFLNKSFEPIKLATVPPDALAALAPETLDAFPQLNPREKRLLRLCDAGFSTQLRDMLPEGTISAFLAGPEELLGPSVAGMSSHFLQALGQQLDIALNFETSRKFSLGRAGVLYAIDHALKYMDASGASTVLIGGVDTYWDHSLMGLLDTQNRVLAADVADGFAPGEGAGFLLLSRERPQTAEGTRTVQLSSPGLAQEHGHMYSDQPYRGDGLSSALQQATVNRPPNSIHTVYSSMNGESFWAKEMGVAMMRNAAVLSADTKVEHPADCFGDIGAAFPAVALGILTKASPGSYLVYGSSDGPSRSAICAEVY